MIEIKQATAEDLPQLAKLAEQTWWHSFPGMISEEQIKYMLSRWYTPQAMLHQMQDERILYVKLLYDGRLVGFASYGPEHNESAMRLHRLYVHPSFQRKGYGSALLHYVERKAIEGGYKEVTLSVNKNNSNAIAMYQRQGFSLRESKKTDIGSGFYMDDYIMAKQLGAPRS